MHKIAAMVYLFRDSLNLRRGTQRGQLNGAINRPLPLNLKFSPKSRGLDETPSTSAGERHLQAAIMPPKNKWQPERHPIHNCIINAIPII